MELTPGTYFVEAIADKERFGETTITIDNQSYAQTSRTFRSTTDPVEVEFNWIKYADSDKMSEGAIFVNDDNLPADLKKSFIRICTHRNKGRTTHEDIYQDRIQHMVCRSPIRLLSSRS